jgi:hypothetical protein
MSSRPLRSFQQLLHWRPSSAVPEGLEVAWMMTKWPEVVPVSSLRASRIVPRTTTWAMTSRSRSSIPTLATCTIVLASIRGYDAC